MNKIVTIAGILVLLVTVTSAVNASYNAFDMSSESHFMRVDSRDAFNRPVASEYRFESSGFFQAYSQISPFGICRFERLPLDNSVTIIPDKKFRIPTVIASFISNYSRVLLRFLEKVLERDYYCIIGIYLMLFSFFPLAFKENLQSLREPRFRVPVLIE